MTRCIVTVQAAMYRKHMAGRQSHQRLPEAFVTLEGYFGWGILSVIIVASHSRDGICSRATYDDLSKGSTSNGFVQLQPLVAKLRQSCESDSESLWICQLEEPEVHE